MQKNTITAEQASDNKEINHLRELFKHPLLQSKYLDEKFGSELSKVQLSLIDFLDGIIYGSGIRICKDGYDLSEFTPAQNIKKSADLLQEFTKILDAQPNQAIIANLIERVVKNQQEKQAANDLDRLLNSTKFTEIYEKVERALAERNILISVEEFLGKKMRGVFNSGKNFRSFKGYMESLKALQNLIQQLDKEESEINWDQIFDFTNSQELEARFQQEEADKSDLELINSIMQDDYKPYHTLQEILHREAACSKLASHDIITIANSYLKGVACQLVEQQEIIVNAEEPLMFSLNEVEDSIREFIAYYKERFIAQNQNVLEAFNSALEELLDEKKIICKQQGEIIYFAGHDTQDKLPQLMNRLKRLFGDNINYSVNPAEQSFVIKLPYSIRNLAIAEEFYNSENQKAEINNQKLLLDGWLASSDFNQVVTNIKNTIPDHNSALKFIGRQLGANIKNPAHKISSDNLQPDYDYLFCLTQIDRFIATYKEARPQLISSSEAISAEKIAKLIEATPLKQLMDSAYVMAKNSPHKNPAQKHALFTDFISSINQQICGATIVCSTTIMSDDIIRLDIILDQPQFFNETAIIASLNNATQTAELWFDLYNKKVIEATTEILIELASKYADPTQDKKQKILFYNPHTINKETKNNAAFIGFTTKKQALSVLIDIKKHIPNFTAEITGPSNRGFFSIESCASPTHNIVQHLEQFLGDYKAQQFQKQQEEIVAKLTETTNSHLAANGQNDQISFKVENDEIKYEGSRNKNVQNLVNKFLIDYVPKEHHIKKQRGEVRIKLKLSEQSLSAFVKLIEEYPLKQLQNDCSKIVDSATERASTIIADILAKKAIQTELIPEIIDGAIVTSDRILNEKPETERKRIIAERETKIDAGTNTRFFYDESYGMHSGWPAGR